MLKCIYNECRWPDCDKTCGLVPESKDYTPESSAEKGLICYLQNRISKLKVELQECYTAMEDARLDIEHIKRVLVTPSYYYDDYPRVCKFGYSDCIHDPGYLRKHCFEWWKELGMPITCEHCSEGEGYDDEDK